MFDTPDLAGRRLWHADDGVMDDLIRKLHCGDPTIGWEGDERLAVYLIGPGVWEIGRWEDDFAYRPICRSPQGGVFDERILWDLCQWDRNRRTRSLHDEITARNEQIDREREAQLDEWVAEEIAPRLRYAIQRE